MNTLFENRVMRPVRACSPEVTVDGLLSVGLGTRTLDEMNLSVRAFVTLFSPQIQKGAWPLHEGPISINKASILFVLEIPDLGVRLERGSAEPEVRYFARSMLRLRVAQYTVEGYVHTLRGGDALARLNQGGHPFLAMSPATIAGPDTDWAVPYVAVNRHHILAAQEILSIKAQPDDIAAGAGDVPA